MTVMRKRFIHTSDLQLGMTRWFLDGEAQARFDDARQDSIDKLDALAKDTGAEFMVVAGDVFERNSLSPQVTGRVKEVFARLSVPVYLLPGNHDPLVADSIFFHAIDGQHTPNVHVITSSEVLKVNDEVEIVGAPLKEITAAHDLVAAALDPLEPAPGIRIGVGHGQIHTWGDDSKLDAIDLDNVEQAIERGVIDYLALGDTHSTQSLGRTGKVWFSGSPEATDYKELPDNGEKDSGNALVVAITKDIPGQAGESGGAVNVEVEKHALGSWVFEAISKDLTSSEDVSAFLEQLRAYPDKRRTVIKYGLRGSISLTDHARLEEGLEELKPIFASLRPRTSVMDLSIIPAEDELHELALRGFAAEAMEELTQAMEHNDTARDAANLLFRLAAKEK